MRNQHVFLHVNGRELPIFTRKKRKNCIKIGILFYNRVQFYIEDATEIDYPESFYDVVYR